MKQLIAFVVMALVLVGAAGASARPQWKTRIDRLVKGREIGVSVSLDGAHIYHHRSYRKRVPASNQKLLTAMALFDELPVDYRITTIARAPRPANGVISGHLWIVGRGDPTVTGAGGYARSLPMRATRLGGLARKIKAAGVRRIRGAVMGSRGYFRHDWFASGWQSDFPNRYIPLPSALSLSGNVVDGRHISDPERRAARALTRKLRALGVRVRRKPGTGYPPGDLQRIARVRSAELRELVRYTNRHSSNFFAEVLGKRLGVERFGAPGTIATGARAVTAWARRRGVDMVSEDASGLSYANGISPRSMTSLLYAAILRPWGPILRTSLAGAGQGTLEDRLDGVRLRAKTGTLREISALSGWIWLERTQSWAQFSILSSGMSKERAVSIEDRIVRILAGSAR